MAKSSVTPETPFDFFLKEISKFEDVSSSHNRRVKILNLEGKAFRNYGVIILKQRRVEEYNNLEFERLRKVYDLFKSQGYESHSRVWFYDDGADNKVVAKERGLINPYALIHLYDVKVGKFKVVHTIKKVNLEDKKGDLFDRISVGFLESHHNFP